MFLFITQDSIGVENVKILKNSGDPWLPLGTHYNRLRASTSQNEILKNSETSAPHQAQTGASSTPGGPLGALYNHLRP